MESQEGRRLHALAEQARERGEFLEALKYTDQAMMAYLKENDLSGLGEVFASRGITFKHLARTFHSQAMEWAMVKSDEAAIEIARLSGQPEALVLPLFNFGKALIELGKFDESIKPLQEAISTFEQSPPARHARPAVLADMKGHLAYAKYQNGDKSALAMAEQALADLEDTDEYQYNKDVWSSGAHMRMAEMLKLDDPEKARQHLQKAKEVIDSNEELKLRREQWENLSKKFS